MKESISPKYLMKMIVQVEKAIWAEFSSYKSVKFYIDKWHVTEERYSDSWENFVIVKKENGEIDLLNTLHGIDGETLLKIAIDLGIETPDFIPAVTVFKNELKDNFKTAFASFEKAIKQINDHPDLAIGLANSTLESIIKEIFQDVRIATKYDKKKTLYQLSMEILKEFRLFPESDMPQELKAIGSSLLTVCQNIESIRSDKTVFHGKTEGDYVIRDSVYAYFVVNTVSTIGMFLQSIYMDKFSKQSNIQQTELLDDLPF